MKNLKKKFNLNSETFKLLIVLCFVVINFKALNIIIDEMILNNYSEYKHLFECYHNPKTDSITSIETVKPANSTNTTNTTNNLYSNNNSSIETIKLNKELSHSHELGTVELFGKEYPVLELTKYSKSRIIEVNGRLYNYDLLMYGIEEDIFFLNKKEDILNNNLFFYRPDSDSSLFASTSKSTIASASESTIASTSNINTTNIDFASTSESTSTINDIPSNINTTNTDSESFNSSSSSSKESTSSTSSKKRIGEFLKKKLSFFKIKKN